MEFPRIVVVFVPCRFAVLWLTWGTFAGWRSQFVLSQTAVLRKGVLRVSEGNSCNNVEKRDVQNRSVLTHFPYFCENGGFA